MLVRSRTFGRLRDVLVVAALVVGMAACSPGDDNANGGLGGTAWTVISIAGTATIEGARPTMRFAFEGEVSGSDGCNSYSGPFRTDGQDIAVGQLGSTLIGCEPLLDAQAQAFMQALTGAATWRQTETGALELRGHGDLIAEPLQAPPVEPGPIVSDLAGTNWVLEELDGVSLVDTVPTIAFGGDGTVSGSAGCNTFSGTFQVEGANLAFTPLATTKMACADPTMFVESAYISALDGVKGWSVGADGRLVLDGARPLTFGPG